MISSKFNYRLVFFDRSVIKTNWKKINESPLKKAGLLVRRISRGSIRRASMKRGKPSKPGTPPRSRVAGASPPFKQIYSLPNKLGTSVIVGMVGYGGNNPVPGLHEHGGYARRRVFVKQKKRRDARGRFMKDRYRVMTKMVKYPERPFMFPALIRAKDRMPALWKNSIARNS